MKLDQIIHGECIQVMDSLPAESVDVIFADPPYNLQLEQGLGTEDLKRPDGSKVEGVKEDWDRFQSLQSYDTFSQAWLKAARRVLKPNGTIWVMGSYHNIFRLGTTLQDLNYWILNDIIWIKNNPMPNFRGRRFTNAHEVLIWSAKDQNARYHFEYQAMKSLNEGLQMRSDWYLPICGRGERLKDASGNKVHPTQKPEALLYRVLLASTKPGDVVLDPFSGTGTTACVAKKLRRRYIGIERDGGYIAHAQKRLAETTAFKEEDLVVSASPASKPRVPFGRLIDNGLLRPGDKLESPCKKWQARIRADGSIKSGKHSGSIHQVSAKLQGATSCNGWTFWQKKTQDGTINLDHLRQKFSETL